MKIEAYGVVVFVQKHDTWLRVHCAVWALAHVVDEGQRVARGTELERFHRRVDSMLCTLEDGLLLYFFRVLRRVYSFGKTVKTRRL